MSRIITILLGLFLICGGTAYAQTLRGGNAASAVCPYGGSGGADGCGGQIAGANFQLPSWASTAIENGASTNLATLTPTWNWPGVHYGLGYDPATVIMASNYTATHPDCIYTSTGGGSGGLAPVLDCYTATTVNNPTFDNLDQTNGGTTCVQVIIEGAYTGVIHARNWRIGNSDACSGNGQHLVYLKFQSGNPVTDVYMSDFSVDGNPPGLCTHVCTDIGTAGQDIIFSNARNAFWHWSYFDLHNLPDRFSNLNWDSYEMNYCFISNISISDYNNTGNHGEIVQANYDTGTTGIINKMTYCEFTMPTTATLSALNAPVFVNGSGVVDGTIQITPTVNNVFFINNPISGGGVVGGRASWDVRRNYFPAAHFHNIYIYPKGSNYCGSGTNDLGASNPGIDSPDYSSIVNLYDMSTIGPYDNPVSPCAGHG